MTIGFRNVMVVSWSYFRTTT